MTIKKKIMCSISLGIMGTMLAGFSVDYLDKGFQGIRDFRKLVELAERGEKHE